MKKLFVWIIVIAVIILGAMALKNKSSSNQQAAAGGAFDQFGYNRTARIFNGTGGSWCTAKSLPADCMGAYSPDKLVMKWNAEWDRGNAENWANAPYDAWIDNEWNGKGVKDGSGAVWHYKIKWVGDCVANPALLPTGSYCVWGQFATIMDQGVDPAMGPGHIWVAHAKPNGY